MNWARQIAKTTGGGRADRESDSRVQLDSTLGWQRRLIRTFSTTPVSGSRPCDGLIHDLSGYLGKLAMLVLAQ
jgi:hypothetical protein